MSKNDLLFAAFPRKRLLLFAKQQQNDPGPRHLDGTETENPANVLFESKPHSTLAAQASANPDVSDYREVATDLCRVACSVVTVSGAMWAVFLCQIAQLLKSGEYKGLLIGKRRRYDETPLLVRCQAGSKTDKTEAQSQVQTKKEAGLAAKIYQSEMHLFFLLHRVEDDQYLHFRGQVPTPLQVVERNTAETVMATQRAVEAIVPGIDE